VVQGPLADVEAVEQEIAKCPVTLYIQILHDWNDPSED
jgi:hypothetical protein